jgi:hypothetical protein
MSRSNDNTGLWIGAAIGGLVLGASVLWLATRKKSNLKDQISDTYECYKDKLVCFANEISENSASDWIKKAKKLAALFERYMNLLTSPKGSHLRQGLLIGGLVGSVIAIGTAIANRRTNADNGIVGRIVDEAGSWRNRISSFVDTLEETHKHPHAHNGTRHASTLDNVLELATTGMELWHRLKK